MSPQKPRDFGMLVSLASTVGLPPADSTRTEVGISSVRYTSISIFQQTFVLPIPFHIFIVYISLLMNIQLEKRCLP